MVFSPKTPNSRIRRTLSAQRRGAVGRGWYHNQYGSAPRLYKHRLRRKVPSSQSVAHKKSKLRRKVIATTVPQAFAGHLRCGVNPAPRQLLVLTICESDSQITSVLPTTRSEPSNVKPS